MPGKRGGEGGGVDYHHSPDRIDELLLHALIAGNLNGYVHEIIQLLLQTPPTRSAPPVQAQLRLCQILKGNLRGPQGAALPPNPATAGVSTPFFSVNNGGAVKTVSAGRYSVAGGGGVAFLVDGRGGGDGDLG